MIFLSITIVTIFIAVILWEIVNLILAKPPKNPHKITIGNQSLDKAIHIIPKIIWSYWHAEPLPEIITKCKENWSRFAPDHDVRMLNKDTLTHWIEADELLNIFETLPAYRQADWLRLQLLKKYGGIWVDASIIFTENLNWLHNFQQSENSEYAGFYLQGFTAITEKPIIENWFMASISNSRFIIDLCDEFNEAIQLGEKKYLALLKAKKNYYKIVQNIDPRGYEYLIMHVAVSVLLNKTNNPYSFALLRAEDTAFSYHSALRWRKKHLYAKLALMNCPIKLPAIIKIRGSDRRILEKGIHKHWVSSRSLLTKYLLS